MKFGGGGEGGEAGLVEGATADHPSHSLLHLGREAEAWQLLLQSLQGAIAPAVAVEAGSRVRRDELLVREPQGGEDISLLAQQVLLVVAGEAGGQGGRGGRGEGGAENW